MPAHESILLLVTVAVAALATGLWVIGLLQIMRRHRRENATRRHRGTLRGLPRQRRTAPHWDSVELTAAERDAFAALVRRFSDGHPKDRGLFGN
ncbi:hypothetical protein ACFYZJ_35560 [Streptomyces sp. NPDC001848]|uniref:hypothetical protein n=1 Tax=Streptomyces sp. NPDC001848 TaxID=3364618 RepID=UPI00369FEA91